METNTEFVRGILQEESFKNGQFDTNFIKEKYEIINSKISFVKDEIFILGAIIKLIGKNSNFNNGNWKIFNIMKRK